MKFIVYRTSEWDENVCPTHAIPLDREVTDDYPSNHISVQWIAEINTLEELIDFQRKERCPLIITDKSIEIYDDYRE